MKTRIAIRLGLAALLGGSSILLVLACSTSEDTVTEAASEALSATAADSVLATALQRLKVKGYTVQNGQFTFFDLCGCYAEQSCTTGKDGNVSCTAGSSCDGNNPTSPYGEYAIPGYPGRTIGGDAGLKTAWQLGDNEAVVFYGQTPPQDAYFSFRSYDVQHVYPDGGTKGVFASLGDSLNDRVIATMGNLDGGGTAFGSQTVVVTTGDQGVFNDVASAFDQGSAFSRRAVNADILDRQYSTMGIGAGADTFDELVRMALPDDASAACAYQANAATALTVLRVTRTRDYDASPIASPPLRDRGTSGEDAGALNELSMSIQSWYAGHLLNFASPPPDVTAIPSDEYGFQCIEDQQNCAGDNRDAVYSHVEGLSNGKPFTFESGDGAWADGGACSGGSLLCGAAPVSGGGSTAPTSFVVYGVNHAVTGESVYTNVTIYDTAMQLGALAVSGTMAGGSLTNSGARYLGDGGADYYAWRFARSCTLPDNTVDTQCSEVPATFPGVATGATLSFLERAYLNPTTNTAPPLPGDAGTGVGIVEPHVLVLQSSP